MYRFNLLVTHEPNSQQDNISFTPLPVCLFLSISFYLHQNESYNKKFQFCLWINNEWMFKWMNIGENEWIHKYFTSLQEFETCCGAEN